MKHYCNIYLLLFIIIIFVYFHIGISVWTNTLMASTSGSLIINQNGGSSSRPLLWRRQQTQTENSSGVWVILLYRKGLEPRFVLFFVFFICGFNLRTQILFCTEIWLWSPTDPHRATPDAGRSEYIDRRATGRRDGLSPCCANRQLKEEGSHLLAAGLLVSKHDWA